MTRESAGFGQGTAGLGSYIRGWRPRTKGGLAVDCDFEVYLALQPAAVVKTGEDVAPGMRDSMSRSTRLNGRPFLAGGLLPRTKKKSFKA